MKTPGAKVCPSCKQPAAGNFCAHCGQSLTNKRITFAGLIHEVFHLFTHLDKGFGHTLKELILHPGKMQSEYIAGKRAVHQKPFSMYLICATGLGVVVYYVNVILAKYYEAGSLSEGFFFHKYIVLFLLVAVPFSTLLVRLFFLRSSYNFSEMGVMQLYTLSFFFLVVACLNLLRLIWPDFETRYLELPVIIFYNAVTFKNFFPGARWSVIARSILCAASFFLMAVYLQDFLVEHYIHE